MDAAPDVPRAPPQEGPSAFSPALLRLDVAAARSLGHPVGMPETVASFVPRAPDARMLAPHVKRALGVLAPVVADPQATDVFVTGDGIVRVDRGSGAEPVIGVHLAPDDARELGVSLIAAGGRHVDESKP